MCGILGYFHIKKNSKFNLNFENSLKKLTHRGPDQTGISNFKWKDGLGQFGHTRLSIIDLSDKGKQPMKSKCGRYSLTFNGEIYNYEELKVELQNNNYQFSSNSDTEVLLAAWIIWGEKSLIKFKGMFSFAIYDSKLNNLTCVRDPFGIKPFYYYSDLSNFYFGSEPTAITDLRPNLAEVNIQKSYEYLLNGTYDNDNNTFFKNIYQLLPGHLLKIDLNKNCNIKIVKWWWPSIKETTKLTFDEASAKLKKMFLQNIKLHLRSDVPIGAALSGGVDSSAIVGSIREIEPKQNINTFSFIANKSVFSEEKWVDIVNSNVKATKYKLNSSSINLKDDFEDLLKTQGEPFSSTSIYAQYKLYEFVKESGVTVTLDGQGADELLAGYGGYPVQRLQSLLDELKFFEAIKFVFNWGKSPNRSRKTTIISLVYNIIPFKIRKYISLFKKKNYFPKYLNKDFIQDFNFQTNNKKTSKLNEIKGRRLMDVLRDSVTGNGLSSLLRHGDRNSMRWSVESRVPFLTTDIAEFLLSLPENYLISDKGETKYIFRDAMRGIVPNEILDRKDKIGFEPPENDWLMSSKPFIDEIVNDLHKVPVFNVEYCRNIITNYYNNPASIDSRLIWRIINYARWYTLNFKN